MTATLDLSSALGLRVANTDALALRIANTDIWTSTAPPDASHLFAAWACDEGSGTSIIDYSPNGRNMTITGSNSWGTGHGYTNAFQPALVSGAGASFLYPGGIAAPDLTGDVTIMGWVKHLGAATDGTFGFGLFSAGGTARSALFTYRNLSTVASSPEVTYRDSTNTIFSLGVNGTTATDNTNYHHYAVVHHTSGAVEIYKDGVLFSSSTPSANPLGSNVRIFGLGPVVSNITTGGVLVNDFRVFSSAVSVDDINAWMSIKVHP